MNPFLTSTGDLNKQDQFKSTNTVSNFQWSNDETNLIIGLLLVLISGTTWSMRFALECQWRSAEKISKFTMTYFQRNMQSVGSTITLSNPHTLPIGKCLGKRRIMLCVFDWLTNCVCNTAIKQFYFYASFSSGKSLREPMIAALRSV